VIASDYIKQALVTEKQDHDVVRSRFTDRNIRLLHAAMGAATEAGELVDQMKKALFYGKPVDMTNLKEELGDVFWYLAIMLDELGIDPQEVMDTNIAKLRARFPEGFTQEAALNRDLDRERAVLENGKAG
jgi:NTP pyrophosphatase (non-canonical NTP hydrolase)